MRKISKSRADEDVISSTNGSMLNDGSEAPIAEVNDGGGMADSDDEKDNNDENDRESGVSYSEGTPKKTKPEKKSKKRKSGKSKTAAEEYEVEKIIDSKKIIGKLHYLIRWKGYSADSDTWEPEKTKENARKMKADKTKTEKKGKKRKSKDSNKSPAKKSKTDWDSSKDDENAEYEVERIMEVHHKKDGSREFLIHWKGWSNKFDSWEPEDNLNCSDLIKRFMDKVNDARKTQSRSLRVAPESTNRFTLQDPTSGRRLSKRQGQHQRYSRVMLNYRRNAETGLFPHKKHKNWYNEVKNPKNPKFRTKMYENYFY